MISLLGFANKAGKLAIGRSAVISAHLKNRVYAVVTARDASEKINSMANDLNVELFRYGTKEELGRILGREEVAIIGILDVGFAKSIRLQANQKEI